MLKHKIIYKSITKLGSFVMLSRRLRAEKSDTVKYFVEGKTNWTFWGYRGGGWQKGNGLRIDHFILSPQASDLLEDCQIEKSLRGMERPSDHVPIWCKLNIS